MAAVKNADGRLEIFAKGNDGALIHAYQKSPGGKWSDWSSLGGSLKWVPAVGRNPDGRLEVFAWITDEGLWHIWQTAPNGGWSSWAPIGGNLRSSPLVIKDATGNLVVFVVANDTALWMWRLGVWTSLGGTLRFSGGTSGYFDVCPNLDGRLEVIANATDHGLWHKSQRPDGSWKPDWETLGAKLLDTVPALGRNADGRLEAFVVSHDKPYGGIWHRWQNTPGGGHDGRNWSDWVSHGGGLPIGGDLAVIRNADGRLELFAGRERQLWHTWQGAPNGAFLPWNGLGGNFGEDPYSGSFPTVVSNADGRIEVFVTNKLNTIDNIWQTSPNNGWSDWYGVPDPTTLWQGNMGRGFVEF